MGSMQSLIVSEAEKFSRGNTLLNTLALYEAALDDPDTYPVIAWVYETRTVRGAKGLITRALLSSHRWGKWAVLQRVHNCGEGNNGSWAVLQRVPEHNPLLDEINRLRGGATGISFMAIESSDTTDYPEIARLMQARRSQRRLRIAQELNRAGWIRRSPHGTYWFAPGCQP